MPGGVAFALAAKLLHPRPKAMGDEFSTVELGLLLFDRYNRRTQCSNKNCAEKSISVWARFRPLADQ